MPGLKAKTIKSIIHNKINYWIESIQDEELRKQVAKNTIVTGGCITSMLLGEPVNDFDIYLRDHNTALKLAEYYVKQFKERKKTGIDVPIYVENEGGRIKIIAKSAGIASPQGTDKPYEYFEGNEDGARAAAYVGDIIVDPEKIEDTYQEIEEKALQVEGEKEKYRPVFLTTNAITLSDKVQVIIRFYGEPDQIHENYDFVHCTNYWTSWDNKLVLRPEALEAILCKELKYVGSKYPVCSVVRLRKFIQRGWRINAGQIVKMVLQISELDLKNISVLEDQLTGVDTAYFLEVISKLKEKDPEKIDSAYLIEIINRIF